MNIKKFVETLRREVDKHVQQASDTETPTQLLARFQSAVGVAAEAAKPRTKTGRRIPRMRKPDDKPGEHEAKGGDASAPPAKPPKAGK